MPTIEVNYGDLLALIGKHVPLEEMQEKAILYAKGEIEGIDGETIKIDIKDTNRPDLWSAEGIAREISGRYVKPGLPKYDVNKPVLEVLVDPKVKKVRPYTVCAVVRGINMDENTLSQMIQLQEKISETFGKKRHEVAIGVYDYHKITGPIKYTTVKPEGIKFVPLEFPNPMTPKQILRDHPKGKEYRHLLEGCAEYPIFIDASGEVLSMPPIINSNHTGKVGFDTKDVFIECSGFNMKFLLPALNVIVTALADRGGRIEGVKTIYPKGYGAINGTIITPDLKPKRIIVNVDKINKLLGLSLGSNEMVSLLRKARYDARVSGGKIECEYPAYRQDIMHWMDVAEDVLISYGYDNIVPKSPNIVAIGKELEIETFSRKVSEIMVGMGLQEILSYVLTNKADVFHKMNMPEGPIVEIDNIVSANWSVFRNWILPSLLEFFSKNKHVEYPQNIFEIGTAIVPDKSKETKTMDEHKLVCALCNTHVGFEDISGRLESLMSSIGVEYELRAMPHPSLIEGRSASIVSGGQEIGIIGEINPRVLNNWGIEKPVAAFEINITKIFKK